MGLFDAFNPFRQWVADVVKPEPPLFVPSFELATVYPPYKLDQTPNDGTFFQAYVLRDYATQSTAEEVRRMFGGSDIVSLYNGNGIFGNGYSISRNQWMVRFDGDRYTINAGRIAWHFTVAPQGKEAGVDTGYWPYGTPAEQVMEQGKKLARDYIDLYKREH
jgi:hypothetical protein